MDCVVWLQLRGVSPDDITWVIPRELYAMDRDASQNMQNRAIGNKLNVAQQEAVRAATSFDEAIKGFETCGFFVKLASSGAPTIFHGAYLAKNELKMLNLVKDIEKRGRIVSIDATGFDMAGGRKKMPQNTLYVDCAAETVKAKPHFKIFQGNKIVLPFMAAGGVRIVIVAFVP
jgi:hypothetical protein